MQKGGFWYPQAASAIAERVDWLFYFILWGSIILFAAIIFALIYFLIAYRQTPTNMSARKQITSNHYLEMTWTILPTILVMFIFYWGYKDYLKLSIPPENAMEIRVIGRQWAWQFEYPQSGVKTLGELVLPVNVPVKFVMNSMDVLHSFFLPNFRIKRDVLPNRYTRIWIEPNRIGQFQIFCAEYCGDSHSNMLATLKVVSAEDYSAWLKGGAAEADKGVPLAQIGEKAYAAKGCNACHTVDGTAKIGPTWKGLFGSKTVFEDGSSTSVDENFIREHVLDPKARSVKGFPKVMSSFKGLLSDHEIDGIIAYIKSLK